MKNKISTIHWPLKILAITLVFSLQVGCANLNHVSSEEDRNEIGSIKSIAILQIPEPLYYKFGEGPLGPAHGSFGVIGQLVTAPFSDTDASSEFGNEFKFSKEMHKKLVTSLRDKDIEVIEVSVTRNENRQLLDSYEGLPVNVDAYLDVVSDWWVGYMTDGGTFDPDFDPYLGASVRLVSARSKKVLFADQFRYSGNSNPFVHEMIMAPEEHTYDTKNELYENKGQAIERLIIGVNTLGSAIMRDIFPPW